jgi:hypothetical protein
MKNKIVLDEDFHFETIEHTYHSGPSETVDYIVVHFAVEQDERFGFMHIVSHNFKTWLKEESTWLNFWSMSELFEAENREYLRKALFDYLGKVMFQAQYVQDLEITANAAKHNYFNERTLNEKLSFEIEELQKEIAALKADKQREKIKRAS